MRRWLALAAFFVAYLTTAKFGLSLATVHPSATPVWPPTGIAVATVLILGRVAWAPVFVAAFLVNLGTGTGVPASLGIALGNALEAVTGAYVLSRWARGTRVLQRAASIFRFALLMLPAVAVSATVGATSLCATGAAPWGDYQSIWLTWWLGDLSGALVVVPLVLAWAASSPAPVSSSAVEKALVFAAVAIVAVVTFADVGPWPTHTPLAFLTIPPLVWAAFRLGQRETTAAVALMSLIATTSTVRGAGPFSFAGPNTSLIIVQAFVATLMTTMVPMAAVVIQWKRAQAARAAMLVRERKARMTAEAVSAAQDEFLAMLSHELRNPLGAIRSAAHVLDLAPPDSDDSRQARVVIGRQVSHLAGVVSDLLDLTRVRTGKVTLERKPVALGEVVARCVDALRLPDGRGENGAAIQLEMPTGETLWVNGDATRLEQVVNNLLSNARKYTPPDGSIRVTLDREGGEAVLRVADTGIGIGPDLLPRIFDQFVQADRDLARSAGGLGLGLTLVKRFVELHGGRVSAGSPGVGRGSVFTVRLPASPAPAAVASPGPAAKARRRVLVVEDQPDVRQMVRLALELAGHEVAEAADGPAGIAAIDRFAPDVGIIDVGLPGFDGYELARRARARLGEAVVLIALTGYGQPEDRRRAEAAGFNLHLVKPVDPVRLADLAGSSERAPASKIPANVPSAT